MEIQQFEQNLFWKTKRTSHLGPVPQLATAALPSRANIYYLCGLLTRAVLMWVVNLLIAWISGVAAYGTIPLHLIQMVPAHGISADWFNNTSALIAMGFKHEIFNAERAWAFIEEQFPGTELLSVCRGCARSVMMRSDLFRLAAVSKFGGFYTDADMAAGWPLEELAAHSAATFPEAWWKDDIAFQTGHFRPPRDELELWQVGNYAFDATAGHLFVLAALGEAVRRCVVRLATKNANEITDLDVLRSTGTYMLSEVYHDDRLAGKYDDVDFVTGDDFKLFRDRDGHYLDRSPAPSSATPPSTSSGRDMAGRRAITDGHLSERRLAVACFQVEMVDDTGDGWDNAFCTVDSVSSNAVVAMGTMKRGDDDDRYRYNDDRFYGYFDDGDDGDDGDDDDGDDDDDSTVCVDAPACYSFEVSAGYYPSEVS